MPKKKKTTKKKIGKYKRPPITRKVSATESCLIKIVKANTKKERGRFMQTGRHRIGSMVKTERGGIKWGVSQKLTL